MFSLPFRTPGRSKSEDNSKPRERSASRGRRPSASEGKTPDRSRSRAPGRARSTDRHRSQSRSARIESDVDTKAEPWTLYPPEEARKYMPADTAEQYMTAGLGYNKPLPKGSFPHATYDERHGRSSRSSKLTKSQLNHALNQINPPPVGAGRQAGAALDAEGSSSLKQRSTMNMIALMHKYIQIHDYDRAGRAFGLLLRLRINNNELDLRKDNMWEVGADILARKGRPRAPKEVDLLETGSWVVKHRGRSKWAGASGFRYRFDNSDAEREADREREAARQKREHFREADERLPLPTAEGLTKVREYYEHLIVQYPSSSRVVAGKVSAPDFYVAMYEQWIHHIDDTRSVEERDIRRNHERLNVGQDARTINKYEEYRQRPLSATPPSGPGEMLGLDQALQRVREQQYARVVQLTGHMDQRIVSYPFSNDPRLIKIRGMSEQWLADLCRPWHTVQTQREHERTTPGLRDELQGGDADMVSADESDGTSSKRDTESMSGDETKLAGFVPHGDVGRRAHLRRAEELMNRARQLEATGHLRLQG